MAGAPAVNDISSVFSQSLEQISAAKEEIAKVIIGQEEVVDQTMITLLAGGHVLLIGVPGLAKTLLVETIATALGLNANRVQCTPDLMPADILGSEVLEEDGKGKRSFRFIKGPIFTQLLMADEINRASPRTQSALLQSMQEKEVSISGQAHNLPEPFHVMATQNPIEQEGTYPLPEAQLDRFLMQVNVDYPSLEDEREVVIKTTTNEMLEATQVMSAEDLMEIQRLVRDMPVGESVVDMIVKLVRNLRPGKKASEQVNEYVTWAPGPRGSQGLMLAVRARALLEGRSAPIEEDVFALAAPVLRHRMALNFKARSQGMELDTLIDEVAKNL